jgi:hypothetical protein
MRLDRVVLTALAVAVSVPAACLAQYTPQWHVGDWWVVKVRYPSMTGHGWQWQHERYDVLKIEKVDGKDCFVLRRGDAASPDSGDRKLFYVRDDNYSVVRRVAYYRQAGRLVGPVSSDFPTGTLGPRSSMLLPAFPLNVTTGSDTAFRLRISGTEVVNSRQSVGIADSILVNHCLAALDSSGSHAVDTRGRAVFSILTEEGAPQEPSGLDVPCTYGLQLWSEGYPWRLYEEHGSYARGSGVRLPAESSWLVACGSAERKQ